MAPNTTRTDGGVRPTSDIPDGLDAIYRKLMAKEPKDRFASADQLAEALAPFTRQSSLHAPREESRTTNDSPKRSDSDAAPAPSDGSPAPAIVTRSVTATLGEAPVDPLGATSTWKSDWAAAEPSQGSPVAPRQAARTQIDSPKRPGSDAAKAPPNVSSAARHVSRSETATLTQTASQVVPPRGPRRKWLLGAGGAAALVMLGVIIITITNKDGTKTKIEVPGDSKVEISNSQIENRKSKIKNAKGWHGWPADAPPPAIAPFNAEQAQQHQEAWAKYLGVPVEYTNTLGMKFRLIPPGEFMMGTTPEEIEQALKVADNDHRQSCIRSEAPKHKVVLSRPIYFCVYEVTQRQYEQVMGKNPSWFVLMNAGKDIVNGLDTLSHPVEQVNWNDAAEFCAKLSQQEKLKPFHTEIGESVTPLDGTGYRLPTEAEWEFSCRAGTATRFWIGDHDAGLAQAGWFGGNSERRTHEVGKLKSNPFGLYDVHGNVWEWVQDWLQPTYYGQFQEKAALDPAGPSTPSSERVIRGGEWSVIATHCRASGRGEFNPANYHGTIGFRVSLSVDAVRQALKVTGPAMPKSVATTQSASPDRRVAEWVLRNGGAVNVGHAGESQHVDQLGKLPDDPININTLSLPGSFAGDFQILENMSLAKLSGLICPGVPVTDDMLRQIKDCREIRFFQLDRSHVTDQGVEFLVANWPNAEHVHLSGTAVGDAGIRHLAGLKQPTMIILSDSKIADEGVRDFLSRVNPSSLVTFNITGGGVRVTDRSLKDITRVQSLQELWVPHTSITDESLAWFAELKSLRSLTLAGTKISNAGVPVFASHPVIEHLNFEKTAITDDGLAQLPQSLTSLYVHSTNVTDKALPHLLRLPKLTTIKVMDTKVTKAGLEAWHKALPRCRIEWDDGVFEPSAK